MDEPATLSFEMVGLPPSPNQTRRMHWAARAKIIKQYRSDAYRLATDARNRLALGGFPWDRAGLAITFYVPDGRRRDTGNLVGSEAIKAAIDGCVLARIIADDDRSHLVEYGPFAVEQRRGKAGFRVTFTRLA